MADLRQQFDIDRTKPAARDANDNLTSKGTMMNTKSLMIALAAFAVGGVAHAITSDEIAAAN